MKRTISSILTGCLGLSLLAVMAGCATHAPAPLAARPSANQLAFQPSTNGEFHFDTGVLRGTLRAGGQSLGLSSVVYLPTGTRLDASKGLFSFYRVFTQGTRYGEGAWDWPSNARLLPDGAVEVIWAASDERPFRLRAVYRWATPDTLDLETIVTARRNLSGFESFLASYFAPPFTNALVWAKPPPHGARHDFVEARPTLGGWLMFPRKHSFVPLIEDGRWHIAPNPVDWIILPRLIEPVAVRRDPASGLSAIVMAAPDNCLAIATPDELNAHRSLYVSQFGRDLKAGHTLRAWARLSIAMNPDQPAIEAAYRVYRHELHTTLRGVSQ